MSRSFHGSRADGTVGLQLGLTQRTPAARFRGRGRATTVGWGRASGVAAAGRVSAQAVRSLRDGSVGWRTNHGFTGSRFSPGRHGCRRAPAGRVPRWIPGRASAASAPVRCAALGFNESRAPSSTRHAGVRGTAHLISEDGARRRPLRFRSSSDGCYEVQTSYCSRVYTS
jgi:hypothetical protein